MSDIFENSSPQHGVEAVRRATRPTLRQRFYAKAGTAFASAADGFALQLDGKPVRTPTGRILAAPTAKLAEAIAAEWDAQRDVIDPAKMPLTRLANVIIDGVSDRPGPVADEVKKYLGTDLVYYRAGEPQGLVERQARHWDPILSWARDTLGARFDLGEGIIHVAQPAVALASASAAVPKDPWRLGAVHAATTLTGSALIALALSRGRLTIEEAWQAAHVDEDWNMEQWGRDEVALARRAFRLTELEAAAKVLQSLS